MDIDALTSELKADSSDPKRLLSAASKIIQDEGGVGGIVSKLSQGGLEQQARSWVGTGTNQPVAASDLSQALGEERLQQAATQAGLPASEASSGLAAALPKLIDRLTPNGQQPTDQGAGTLSGVISQLEGA